MKQFLVIVGFCLFKFIFSLVANIVPLGIEYLKNKDKEKFKKFFKFTLNTNLSMTVVVFAVIGSLQLFGVVSGQSDWIFSMGYTRMILFTVGLWLGELIINTVMLGFELLAMVIDNSISRDK